MNIVQAMRDPNLFSGHFPSLDSWGAWLVVLSAVAGLPLSREQQRLFTECTGREYREELIPREVWLTVGRRGGKSRIVALLAVVLALFNDHREHLMPGEVGHVMVIAVDRRQARIVLRYIEAFLDGSPLLARKIVKRSAEAIELDNNIHIVVASCSLRSVRGYTVVGAICDEIAFWRSDDSANPDFEVLNAIRPAMATIPNSMLFCISSPYARRGAMWEAHKKYFGEDADDVLVWQAPTWVMNPTVPQRFLDRERERDPLAFQSEYGAQFRSDIAAALDPDWIDLALCRKNLDAPRSPHPRPYVAFVDMSGGRSDSATLAIAHTEPDEEPVFVDALRRFTPPFSPETVVKQMIEVARGYGVNTVIGDNYSAELVVDLFRKRGVGYMASKESASDIYLQSLPLFSTGKIQAPDHKVLRAELTALERRTRATGKDLITHPPGAHDDLANAMCGAVFNAWRARGTDLSEIFAVESNVNRGGAALVDEYRDPSPWSLQ